MGQRGKNGWGVASGGWESEAGEGKEGGKASSAALREGSGSSEGFAGVMQRQAIKRVHTEVQVNNNSLLKIWPPREFSQVL